MNTYTPDATKIVHETNVDFNNKMIGPVVHIRQYDVSLPVVKVKLYNAGNIYKLPTNVEANVRFGKGDGTFVYNPVLGCSADRSVLYFEISQQMAVVYGDKKATIELIQNGVNVANSSIMTIEVEKNPVQESDIESTDEANAIREYVAQAQSAATKAQTSELNAKDSEDKALASEVAAKISEDNASASETKAAVSEANAVISETNAKESETNASTSETNAKDSEDKAQYYYEQTKELARQLDNVFKPKGTITFIELPEDLTEKSGWVYNISDAFVTDDRFLEGAGVKHGPGTNVVITEDAKLDCLVGSMVTSVNGEVGDVVIPETPIATAEAVGTVKPDGETITIDEDGTLHGSTQVDIATTGKVGVVKPDGETITVDADGTIHSIGGGSSTDIEIEWEDYKVLREKGEIIPNVNYFVKNFPDSGGMVVPIMECTQAYYDSLSEEVQNAGIFFINDAESISNLPANQIKVNVTDMSFKSDNVQGVIGEIDTEITKDHKQNSWINIIDYNSPSNMFAAPSDGYALLNEWGGNTARLEVYTRPVSEGVGTVAITANKGTNSLFIKKGMKLYVTLSTTSSVQAYFTGID